MARNRIQFQKGLSETRFAALYGSEERCREALASWRWPEGFICPKCGGREHCVLSYRCLYQCNACRRQTSLTAGTIFDSTKVTLTTWFRAMYLITQTKQGISSIDLVAGSASLRRQPGRSRPSSPRLCASLARASGSMAGSRWMMPISVVSARAARQGAVRGEPRVG